MGSRSRLFSVRIEVMFAEVVGNRQRLPVALEYFGHRRIPSRFPVIHPAALSFDQGFPAGKFPVAPRNAGDRFRHLHDPGIQLFHPGLSQQAAARSKHEKSRDSSKLVLLHEAFCHRIVENNRRCIHG